MSDNNNEPTWAELLEYMNEPLKSILPRRFTALHYADEKPQFLTPSQVLQWATDEGYDGDDVDEAAAFLNDIGNVSVTEINN